MRYLNTPGRIGALRLRNRVIMAPLGTNFGTTDGFATERDRSYYTERAIGGVAMIMTEAMIVSSGARNHHNSLCIFDDRFIPGLAMLAESIKAAGAFVVGQLSHRGGLLRRDVLNMTPVGPSPWRNPNTGDEVRPLDVAEIVQIQKDFVRAARRLAEASYDGIELHAANGYLFHQFFSPRVNKRTDAYGGSLEGRMRFLLETIARIRDELPNMPLIVRFSASEFTEGGYTIEEAIELARALERAGVDALDMSGGTNESPKLSRFCIQPPSFPRRFLEPAVRPIKQAVSIPVILAGRIIEPEDAEAVLAAGSADFVSLGRALVSDPHWVLKAFGQLDGPIRHCISCNVCFERLTRERDISCVQNPMVGTEFERLEHITVGPLPPERRKRVLVIGAGVSGIEAANTAAARGHTVEVWEVSSKPGGQIEQAIAAPGKSEVRYVWEDRWNRFLTLGIPLRFGKRATIDEIRVYQPDHVILATGAVPRQPQMIWPKGIQVLQAWDVLRRPALITQGSDVLIVGGGMVGIETADLLITRDCKVTIVEMQASLAAEMPRNNRTDILLRLSHAGAIIYCETVIESVNDNRVRLNRGGEMQEIACPPYVVLAIGSASRADLASLLEEARISFTIAGDGQCPGDFLTAIRDGHMAGLSVERKLDWKRLFHRSTHRVEAASS